MTEERDETWWPVGTLEERMNHGADAVEAGDPVEMRAKMRAWRLEHEAVLKALGHAVAGEDEDDELPPDLDDYDDLLGPWP